MQQPKRFQAPTLGEAYALVRAELGGDAIILSTRKAASPGLFGLPGRQFVEVVAHLPEASEEPRPGRRPTFDQDMAAHELVRGLAEAAAIGLPIDPAIELAELEPPFESPSAGLLPRRAVRPQPEIEAPQEAPKAARTRKPARPRRKDESRPEEMAAEMPAAMPEPPFEASAPVVAGPFSALNDSVLADPAIADPAIPEPVAPRAMPNAAPAAARASEAPVAMPSIADRALVATLARQLTEVRTLLDQLVADRVTERVEAGPPILKEVHGLLVRQGLSQAVLSPLLAQVSEALVRDHHLDSALRTVERKLSARMPPVAQIDLGRRPAAIFLVGPSGAGKTTMAVRLGLQLARVHGLRATVAGTDVSRAGAPQQLVAYGAASGMDVRLCYAPGELKAILEDGTTDIVIVDTPGHNGTRRDRMVELNAFAQVARRRSVLLALPATMKGGDINDVVAAYSGIGIDGLVLTRCDETTTFGALASVAIEASIGIAYTAHSDQVGDPARSGDNFALASAVVSGRWANMTAERARSPVASPVLARVG